MKQFLIGLALTLTVLGGAEAATYYVGTTGSDANSCLQAQNANTPKRNISTVNGGTSCLQSGDTLRIRGGTYSESIKNGWGGQPAIPSGRDWSSPTTYEGYSGEMVVLAPAVSDAIINFATGIPTHHIVFRNLVLDGVNTPFADVHGVYAGQDYLRFDGVEVKNFQDSTAIQVPGSNNEFTNCSVHDTNRSGNTSLSYAFYLGGTASNNLIEKCKIYNHGAYGIHNWSNSSSNNNVYRFNTIYNTGQTSQSFTSAGIIVSHGSGHQVYSNIIYNNFIGIIADSSCTNCRIYNNTVYSNKVGLYIYPGAANNIVKNNIVYQNLTGDIFNSGVGTVISNNLTVDPKFMNSAANDFRLQSGSPAIDAGADMSAFGLTADIGGGARPQGCCYDIGAYEYGSTSAASPITTTAVTPSNAPAVAVESTFAGYSIAAIVDGVIAASGGTATTWASADSSSSDHWVNVPLAASRTINTATIFWAFNSYQQKYMSSQKVFVQYWDGSTYQTAATINYTGDVPSSSVVFPAVTTTQLRFYQPANQGNPSYPGVFWITELKYDFLQPGLTVDSSYAGYTVSPIDDGTINASGGASTTWASADQANDHWINVAFSSMRQLNTATVVWAYNTSQQKYMTAKKVDVQYWDGAAYQTIGSIAYPGSDVPSSSVSFASITTSQLRFVMPAGQGNPGYPNVFWVTEVDYAYLNAPNAPSNVAILVQ